MHNPIQKFRQSSTVFEKPGFLFENLKALTSSNYPRVQYFLLKLRIRFLIFQCLLKGVLDFLFCINLEIFAKIKKARFLETRFFYIFINNSRSKQKEKNSEHTFVDVRKQKMCAKF